MESKKEQIKNILGINYDAYSQVMDITIMPGWNSNSPNFDRFVPKEPDKLCLEVGSWTGGSAKTISSLIDNSSCLICCDTFLGSEEHFISKEIAVPRFTNGRPALFEMFIKNTKDYADKILPMQTTANVVCNVLQHFNIKLDFIYIDGDHSADAVEQDVRKFYTLLADGGVLLGDDLFIGGVEEGLKRTGLPYTVEGTQYLIRK